jgi:hypothetical protein
MPDATPPPAKPAHQSKAAWIMVVTLVGSFFPQVQEWIAANPVKLVQVLAAFALVLRFVSNGRLILFPDDDDDSLSGSGSSSGLGSGGGKGDVGTGVGPGAPNSKLRRTSGLPWLVVSACVAVLLLLNGCTPAQREIFKEMPITIGIEGQHGTYAYSSKGGLTIAVKGPKVREEKRAIDIESVIEREHKAGRFAEPVIPPGRMQRRMVLP